MPRPTRSQSVQEPQHGGSRTRLPQAGISVRESEGLSSTTNKSHLATRVSQPAASRPRGTKADIRTGHARIGSSTASRIPLTLYRPHNSTRQVNAMGDDGVNADSTSGEHRQRMPPAASAASHTRSQSQSSSSVKSQIPSTPSAGHRTLARPRPNFDNFQQHFSPKKPPPQDQTHSVMRPASGATQANAPRDAEAQGMHDELLQLSLVHEQASRLQGTFEAKARRKLEDQRSSTSKRHAEVAELDTQHRRHQDLEAVTSWLHVDEHIDACDRVCSLSSCIADISELTSNESTLNKLLHMFETWRTEAERTLCRQQKQPTDTDTTIDFIEPMDRELLGNFSLAHERLSVCRRTLASLGDAGTSSSLGKLLERHTVLVEVLLEEIETCQNLHTSMMRQQEAWIAASIADIVRTETTGDGDPYPRRGNWESLHACD